MADTIAAIATPAATGSIGVIRISGDDAGKFADRVFKAENASKRLCEMNGYTAAFGHIYSSDKIIDECVALNFKAPHSYTGENVVELSLHGGAAVLKMALRAIYDAGARPALPGEFTKRAFLNGKMSLTQAEAVMDIIGASSASAVHSANSALCGKSFEKITKIKDEAVHCGAIIAAFTDFPEEGTEYIDYSELEEKLRSIELQLEELINNYDAGAVLRNGIDCAIVGKPNVGKSTLMNVLSGKSRSIVTSFAGTTRDIVEETVDIGGCLLKLSDTAGIHSGNDEVEKIGIEKAVDKLKNSQLVLAVFSAEDDTIDADFSLLELCGDIPVIIVVNKTDLATAKSIEKYEKYGTVFEISAKTGEGVEALKKGILELSGALRINPNDAMLSNERQLDNAKKALASSRKATKDIAAGQTLDAIGVVIDDIISSLLSLSGENVSESVVSEVFAKFCVGK